MAGYDLSGDKVYGLVTTRKSRTQFLAFCSCLRSLHPDDARIAIVPDDVSLHWSTTTDRRVGDWAAAQSRGVGLRAVLRLLAQSHRVPVHRPALFRPRRHRPPLPP